MAIVERDLEEIELSDSPVDSAPGMSFFQAAKEQYQKIQRKLCPCRSKPPTIKKPPPLHVPKYWTDDRDYLLSKRHPIGIITLEDVIEALIQSSILDEKDISLGRRRMKGTGSPNSSRIITSSEQTQASNSRESLTMRWETRYQTPLFRTEVYDANLSPVRETSDQLKTSASRSKSPPLSPLSLVRAKSQSSRKRRVSFPDGYPGGDGTPYLSQDIGNIDGRDFKSKTFPRSKEFGKIKTKNISTGSQLIDLLGPMSDEDMGYMTVSERGMGSPEKRTGKSK